MSTPAKPQKVECLNPNTGGKMNIDKSTYDLFSKAIHHTLKHGSLSFAQMTAGTQKYFTDHKIVFDGAVGWYTVTIKNDMEARGIITTFIKAGKKLHQLAK